MDCCCIAGGRAERAILGENRYVRAERAIYIEQNIVGFYMAHTRLSEAERYSLTKKTAQRLKFLRARATELGREPDCVIVRDGHLMAFSKTENQIGGAIL